jgi:DNA-binding NarL/FixJ family response regulator
LNNRNTLNKAKILSKRQEEVFNLIKIGKSNQSIATELNLTIPTIKMHVSAIFKKLDVKNRTEAVAKYSDMQRVSELIS